MSDFTVYYWPAPFRGEFPRAVLAHAGADWTEAGTDATADMMGREVADQPVPFMAPPLIHDSKHGVYISEMPAILAYLGDRFGLLPANGHHAALTHKIIADSNDILDEITCDGGREMWTADKWAEYEPRLARWMQIFEETGRRHGLTADAGHMLGTDAPGLADLVTYSLWYTMTDKLPPLAEQLEQHAPSVAALCRRLSASEALTRLREWSDAEFGDIYCGGQIEASLRDVLS
ncbi:glutathione S-transferase [Tranquillimonas rosea]|uniref:Glutathione S-transferase n=1 Tax=Tranquillimonas rosea TaxID=641238 RepID=A0A1H9WRA6_9RHOB|nr:glutathione S-transferase [Tranquillimonas rosea]SES36341.1 glutathione S-transferase [Tranquillimonas rosea]